jgi:hypothetical protein
LPTIDIDFDWTRALDYELADSKKGLVIRQKGRRSERIWPLKFQEGLYRVFEKLDGSPEACLGFARSWGLLESPAPLRSVAEEHITDWRHSIQEIRGLMKTLNINNAPPGIRTRKSISSLEVMIAYSANEKPAIVLRPQTLLEAMKLQLAQSVASGNAILTCQQCGTLFEVGAGARRTVSRFCSVTCKNRHHYKQRGRK